MILPLIINKTEAGGGSSGLTADQLAAINAANAPNAGNPFATVADIVGGSQQVFIQDNQPSPVGVALWVQTGLGRGGEGFTLWALS